MMRRYFAPTRPICCWPGNNGREIPCRSMQTTLVVGFIQHNYSLADERYLSVGNAFMRSERFIIHQGSANRKEPSFFHSIYPGISVTKAERINCSLRKLGKHILCRQPAQNTTPHSEDGMRCFCNIVGGKDALQQKASEAPPQGHSGENGQAEKQQCQDRG